MSFKKEADKPTRTLSFKKAAVIKPTQLNKTFLASGATTSQAGQGHKYSGSMDKGKDGLIDSKIVY